MQIKVYHPSLGKDRVVLMDEGTFDGVWEAKGWKKVAAQRKVKTAAKKTKAADNLTGTEEV